MPKGEGRRTVVGAGYIIAGATSIQWSSAIATTAIHAIGPSASSAWRFLLGSVVLLLLTRPAIRRWTRDQWRGAVLYGLSVALMNVCFFQALARIPLGSTVTIEFLGPLAVAVLGQRSVRHALFALLAAVGVLLLGHPGGHLNAPGVLFGLGAAFGWALYLFTASHLGGGAPGFGGLAVSMSVASLVTLPFALGSISSLTAHPFLLGRLAIVATMATVIGFALEMQALRNVSPAIAGVMMSFDPATAFVLGYVLLAERASWFDITGLACVISAGIGVTLDHHGGERSALAEVVER